MITKTLLVAFMATLCLGQTFIAPWTQEKFRPVLQRAKLQAPGSNTAASSADLQRGYASKFFNLQGSSIQFQISGSGQRSELREMTLSGSNAAWSVASSTSRSLNAVISVPAQASGIEELTLLQIHCGEGPALRVSWRRSYKEGGNTLTDVIISNVRFGSGPSDVRKKFLVNRSATPTTYKVEVRNSRVVIDVGSKAGALSDSLSYWSRFGNSCYFKAGAYNNNPTSSSANAVSLFSAISW